MSDSTFQPIFDYIDKSLQTQKEEILSDLPTKDQITKLQNTVDKFVSRIDKNEKNIKVESSRVARIENWVIKAAEQTKVSYRP